MIIYKKDLEGKYILTNKLFLDVYQLSGDQHIGKCINEIVHNDEKINFYNLTVDKVMASKPS